MNRTNIFISLIVLFFLTGCIQPKLQLEIDYFNYISALNELDYERAIGYLPDKVFENVPRETVIEQYSEISSEYGNLIIDSIEIVKPFSILEDNGILYAKIQYSAKVVLNLREEKEERFEPLLNAYIEKFSEENISHNKDELRIEMKQSNAFYGISTEGGKAWKFLEDNHAFYKVVIPDEVLTELNSKKNHRR